MRKVERIQKTCPVCGKTFLIRPNQTKGVTYCSIKCFGIDPNRDKKRPNNGKNFGTPWAKGKSKETDPKLKALSETNKKIIQGMYDRGEIDLTKRKTNYTEVAKKISDTISRKLADGTLKNQYRFVKGWYTKKDGTKEWYESSYELKYMEMLDNEGRRWTKVHRIRIPYFDPIKKRDSYYVPDFLVDEKEIHEVKPEKHTTFPKVMAKSKAGGDFCLTRGWIYRIITEKELKI